MKIDPKTLDFRASHHLTARAITPRPIVLISTVGENGVFNVAPMGTLTRVSMKPMVLGFEISTRRDGTKKDTIRNIESSKEFVVAVVTESLAEPMNRASHAYPSHVSEFKETGMTPVKAEIVKAPLVGESPANFECRLLRILQYGRFPHISQFVIGKVVMVHVEDEYCLDDGYVDALKWKPVGRAGVEMCCRVTDLFQLKKENLQDGV